MKYFSTLKADYDYLIALNIDEIHLNWTTYCLKTNQWISDGQAQISVDFHTGLSQLTEYVFKEILIKNLSFKWLEDANFSTQLQLKNLSCDHKVKLGPHFYPETFLSI